MPIEACTQLTRTSTRTYASIAAKVDTQITTQAAKKLLSIRVSNFMAALSSASGKAFDERFCKVGANGNITLKTVQRRHLRRKEATRFVVRGQVRAVRTVYVIEDRPVSG